MNTISNINFGSYSTLKQLLSQPNFDPASITHLDFSHGNHSDTPPSRALKLLPNLKSMDLSHNKIDRFNSRNLLDGAPLLEELNISHNDIRNLDDLIELGGLKSLERLNFLETPVAKKIIRIKLVEFLLRPSKYKPYTPIKVLTATYRYVADESKLDPDTMEEYKKFNRLLERDLEEIDVKEFEVSGPNKYDHKYTPIKLAKIECPVPRKTRFPMLKELNKEIISIQDMRQIFMTEDINDVFESRLPKRRCRRHGQEKNKLKGISGKLYRRHLEGYRRQRERKIEEGYRPSNIKSPADNSGDKKEAEQEEEEEEEEDDEKQELNLLWEMDQKDQIKKKKANENYNSVQWRRPKDLDWKDAEYNIGISEHKKMMEEYEYRKKVLKEEKTIAKKEHMKKIREEFRKEMEKQGINRGNRKPKETIDGKKTEGASNQAGNPKGKDEKGKVSQSVHKGNEKQITVGDEGSWDSIESDPEIRRTFRSKIKKKPKLNLEHEAGVDVTDNSTESNLSEQESEAEEKLHPIREMLALSALAEQLEETAQKEGTPLDTEELERAKTLYMGKNTSLRDTKEWKSTIKDFKTKLEKLEKDSRHQSESPVKEGESMECKSPSWMRNISPQKKILLKKMETIEMIGPHSGTPVKTGTMRFYVSHESTPNLSLPIFEGKRKVKIKRNLENKERSKGEVEENGESEKKKLLRKGTKEYRVAKEITDEAKRISMNSPIKKGKKEVEWGNVIVNNELARLDQPSYRKGKLTLALREERKFDEQEQCSDEELFNFITQAKNVTTKMESESKHVTESMSHSPENLKTRQTSQSFELNHFSEDPRYLNHSITPEPIPSKNSHLNNSCTPSSFDIEYISALNPLEDYTKSPSNMVEKLLINGAGFSAELSRNEAISIKDQEGKPLQDVPLDSKNETMPDSNATKNEDIMKRGFRMTSDKLSISTERTSQEMISVSKLLSRPSTSPWNIQISYSSAHSNDLAMMSEKARQSSQLEFNHNGETRPIRPQTSMPLTMKADREANSYSDKKAKGYDKVKKPPFTFQNLLDLAIDLEKRGSTPKNDVSMQGEQKKTAKDFKITKRTGSMTPQNNTILMTRQGSISKEEAKKSLDLQKNVSITPVSKVHHQSLHVATSPPNLPLNRITSFEKSIPALGARNLSSRSSVGGNTGDLLAQLGSARTQGSLYTIGEMDSKRERDGDPKRMSTVGRLSTFGPKVTLRDIGSGQLKDSTVSLDIRKRLCVEDLLPSEKDGLSEHVRLRILNGRNKETYKKILETAERLEEFSKVIEEAEQLPAELKLKGSKKEKIKFPSKEINYDHLAEFLRQCEHTAYLDFKNHPDLRKLIYLVNDYTTEGELRMSKLEVEEKLRQLKMKTLKAEREELEWLHEEIETLTRYWEIMEDLDLARENLNDPKTIMKLEDKELNAAENAAIIAAHCKRLQKYYGDSYMENKVKGNRKHMQSAEVINPDASRRNSLNPYLQKRKHRVSQVMVPSKTHINNENKEEEKKTEVKKSLADEIRKIEQEKRNALFGPAKVGDWKGKEPLWVGGVERYVPEKMLGLEDLMENIRMKKVGEAAKQRAPTEEEQMINEVVHFREERNKKKELKVRVEKYVKEAGKTVDDFLEKEYKEIERRHDKKHCFQMLMSQYIEKN